MITHLKNWLFGVYFIDNNSIWWRSGHTDNRTPSGDLLQTNNLLNNVLQILTHPLQESNHDFNLDLKILMHLHLNSNLSNNNLKP